MKILIAILLLVIVALQNPYGPLAVPILILGLGFTYIVYKFFMLALRENPLWSPLVDRFDNRDMQQKFFPFTEKRVFFRTSADNSFDSYNLVKICTNQGGIDIRPSSITESIKPIFIPDESVELVGSKRIMLLKRSIYQVKGTTLQIAF